MELDVVQVRVVKPLAGPALQEENELRQQRATLDERLERLKQRLAKLEEQSASTARPEEEGTETDADPVARIQKELKAANAERAKVQVEIESRIKARTITLDVQTTAFGGRIRQMEAIAEVEAWRLAQKQKNLGLAEDAAKQPEREELEEVPLTDQQREDYVVMSTCAAVVGAVCRDAEGRPVCSNFEWPADMHGWTGVPAYLVEPVLMQVYALNPSWAPDWMALPEDDAAKNG
jgi:hypothetical protein